MPSYYKCARCHWIASKKDDMIIHLERVSKCEIKNLLNIKSNKELYDLSIIPQTNDKDECLEIFEKFKCDICEKVFRDNCNKNKHYESCRKKKEKLGFTNEQMKEKYNKKKEKPVISAKTETEKRSEENVEGEDPKINIYVDVDNSVNQTINFIQINVHSIHEKDIRCNPFEYLLDFSHFTYRDKISILHSQNYDLLIDKLLENPLNQNILFNDENKKRVTIFRSYEKGLERVTFTDVLDKYTDDGLKIILSFLLDSYVCDSDMNIELKTFIHQKIQKNYLEIKKKLKDHAYQEYRYETMKSIIPSDEKVIDGLGKLEDTENEVNDDKNVLLQPRRKE